jgi:hypothetical protein
MLVLVQPLSAGWGCKMDSCLAVATVQGNQWNVHLASDGHSGAFVVWQDRRDGSIDKLFYQRIDFKGNPAWQTNGWPLSITQGYQYYPQIISDGLGGAIIVWQDNRTSVDYDIYAQRVSASGALLWEPSGVAVCTSSGNQYNPQLVSDGTGGAIVVWQDRRNGNYDIYAQRIGLNGVPAWTANGVSICTSSSDQVDPEITGDGAGGAIFAWTDYRSGGFPDIYSQRVDGIGAPKWTANGIDLYADNATQWKAQLVSDGANGAIISWVDGRNNTVDQIYAQRVDTKGSLLWNATGIPLCALQGNQSNQRLVSDGANGAVVVWQENRTGSNYDIYGQRINGSGTLLWPASGKAICTAPDQQYYPQIVTGRSSVLVAWQDRRNGTVYQTYAQLVALDGSTKWVADGQLAFQSSANQVSPACAPDGVGGIILGWSDYGDNSGTTNILSQRIGSNGFIGGGCFRSFTQTDYSQKAIKFFKKTAGILSLPGVGNLRDSVFLRGAFPGGMIIGVVRKDSARKYGWIKYVKTANLQRVLPQTGPPRPFDILTGTRKFIGAVSNPLLTRYNNQIVGAQAALKLTIAASDYGMVPRGFGELVYNDTLGPNPLNGKSLRQVTGFVDSVQTMWQKYAGINYGQIASSLSDINAAFTGPIDTVSTSPLSFEQVNPLFATGILSLSPAPTSTVLEEFRPNVMQENATKELPLLQNYPNPFNPTTVIRFDLLERSSVTLRIFNLLGQEIGTLLSNEILSPGIQSAQFDGSSLSSGTYFYYLTAIPLEAGKAPISMVRKMLLIK